MNRAWLAVVTVLLVLIVVVPLSLGPYRVQQDNDRLSVEELAHVLGVQWWTMTVPSDAEGKTLGLRFKTAEGIEGGGGVSGFTPGQRIKLILLGLDQAKTTYAVVGAGSTATIHTANRLLEFDGSIATTGIGSEIRAGEVLIRKSPGDAVTGEQTVGEGEVGLLFAWE